MKNLETELCSYSLEAVRTAVREGVTRVELCAGAPSEGGMTPSPNVIAEAREATRNSETRPVELSVMIRPHGGEVDKDGDDFVYSAEEFEQMKRDIAAAKTCGADGVVFGLLTPNGDVDTVRTRELVELARPLECTFHRAFDVARDWPHALEEIISTGCRRILTSGQRASAPEGIEIIRELVRAADGRIEIMAGAGVNPQNARKLAATGVDALHFSARNVGDPRFVREMVAITNG